MFSADFESFLRTEVNLNKTRLDRLQDRVDAIESFISANDVFGDIFIALIPAGSWAHRTIIKPVTDADEFDADVLLQVEEQTDWLPKDYIENLYSAFRSNGTYKDLASRKTRCVRIDYAGDFHVDVVPYLERAGDRYITNRLDPKDAGSFELSDPEAFSDWMDERERMTSGTFVKVVRLIKYLRDYKNTFTCKSIILTTLLGNQVDGIEASAYPALYQDVPSALVTLLTKLADSLPASMPAVMDPAGTGENFTDRYGDTWDYSNFRSRIRKYAEEAKLAYDETDRAKSISLWREIFGDGFKPGELAEVAKLSPLSTAVTWSGEQFIHQHPFNYRVAIDPGCSVKVTGRCSGFLDGAGTIKKGFRQFSLPSQGNRVPKQRRLVFTASVSGVQPPYRVFWKVRNGGEEANKVTGGLRGEITEDAGKHQKTETTSYRGSHYAECYVVKDGVVVAKDRQTVIVTS